MAVLAPQDWHPPRDHTMDLPSTNPNPSVPRQRSSPVNDHSPSPSPTTHQLQQPYPYPVQQQPQGGWTPSISAQPFYPSFYQNQHQPSYPAHPHPPHPQVSQQNPYFDPSANAQLAQWAYQQMMFNAQQAHQMQHIPSHHSPLAPQRSLSSSGPNTQPDYFTQNQLFSPFPSGTPPPHQNHLPNSYNGVQRSASSDHAAQTQYNGFHPYRRPTNRPAHTPEAEWRSGSQQPLGPFQPPYARGDASASSSSINSSSSNGAGSRQRTSSIQGSSTGRPDGSSSANPSHSGSAGSGRSRAGPPQSTSSSDGPRARTGSGSSSTNGAPSRPHPHHRNPSSSSTSTSSGAPRPSASTNNSASTTSSHNNPAARPARPSPLSQGNFTAAEKRMSRDDSDLPPMHEPSSGTSMRSGGLKGRFRRALSLNAAAALEEETDKDDISIKASSSRKVHPINKDGAKIGSSGGAVSDGADTVDAASTTAPVKKKSRAASLFNSRLNASTDNISLSSTVSSASVMIRKLGSIGKLARRNSLAGITSLFKDKKEKEGEPSGSKKKKKSGKGDVVEPSVSHAIVELDRSSDWSGPEMSGLSPAAKLARQHTLKSNAEAAAKAKAQQEAAAAAAAAQKQAPPNGAPVPATWEKNTTTRSEVSPVKAGGQSRVNEDGTKVIVEDDDSASGDDHHYPHQLPEQSFISDGWDDDETWGQEEEEEDVTIRVGLEKTGLGDDDDENLEWGANIRRSVERTKVPAKGILKGAEKYDQQTYLTDQSNNPAYNNRVRSNSYTTHTGQPSELGPLARIPSPDPDHIDGLHRHPSHSSSHSNSGGIKASLLPPLELGSSSILGVDSPKESDSGRSSPHPPERSMFNHPNSSAPALSTIISSPPTLTHRSATTPAKRLTFANNLSVYDTFPPSVYDRRSEPATWSRLTPALAQRIKEELNSYKMEEMEVHASSRMHTQFFI